MYVCQCCRGSSSLTCVYVEVSVLLFVGFSNSLTTVWVINNSLHSRGKSVPCVFMHMCLYVLVCVFVCVCHTRARARTHTHTSVHMHTPHIYTHEYCNDINNNLKGIYVPRIPSQIHCLHPCASSSHGLQTDS